MNRNVLLLSCNMALGMSGAPVIVLLGGIIGTSLAPDPSWATLPVAMLVVGGALFTVPAAILYFLKEPRLVKKRSDEQGGVLGRVVREPRYLTAVMAGVVAYGVMAFIMTATPVSMHLIDRFSLDDTTLVIQSHIVAMFLPSLFTGALIGRLGLSRIMLAGTFLMGACAAISFIDRHFIHYWAGLVLLGVGWNFLFVGGTTLLTRTYEPRDRFKAQAMNDVTVFGFQAFASLSAGTVLFGSRWEVLNGLSLPLLAITAAVLLRMRKNIDR